MKRLTNWLLGILLVLFLAVLSISIISPEVRSYITRTVGIAVAQSNTVWKSVNDAAKGDSLTDGVMAISPYLYNGITFDRVRGDTTYGMDVDVTRLNDGGNTISVDDGGGSLTVDDGGSSLTVDGTVTVNDGGGTISVDDGGGSLTVDGTISTTPEKAGTGFYAIKRTDIDSSASVNLAFGFTSKKVMVETDPNNTGNICVDWTGGTAACPAANTAGDDVIPPGRSIILDNYAVTSISVISDSASAQTVYIRAWY